MDLDRVHAQWTLGLFPVEQIPEFAAQAMIQGFDGPSILELASFHRPTVWDIKQEVFDAAMTEMGRKSLSRGEAGLRLARVTALKILRNQVSPEDGAAEIRSLISRCGYPEVPGGLLDFQYGLYDLEDRYLNREESSLKLIELAWSLVNREPG